MSAKRIVVIDDSPLILAMTADALEEAGHHVFVTDSGIEANQFIYSSGQRPDLILIDVMMPMLTGDRKVRLLKERTSSRDIPVVLMSSKSAEELEELSRVSGADGFISKPFNKYTLLQTVDRLLS